MAFSGLSGFPWRQIVSWLARQHSFIDPMTVIARLHRFGQPSEVNEPIELLRAGVIFHARGLLNTRAIQHNLDWVWPFWIERQFDPRSVSFLPRAFSITHVNLTHRNWTAVGLPDLDALPIVDPRGLVTPLYDEWSLDAWIVPQQGKPLLPSQCQAVEQDLLMDQELAVRTVSRQEGLQLTTRAEVCRNEDGGDCVFTAEACCDAPAWLVLTLRPANPEGVAFVHRVQTRGDGGAWIVDDQTRITFDTPPEKVLMSTYAAGDVARNLPHGPQATQVHCEVGMATAAAMYELTPGQVRRVRASVPLVAPNPPTGGVSAKAHPPSTWPDALRGSCEVELPDEHMVRLFEAAKRTMVLHAPGEVYPGPYIYKRFWFRDAAIILDAMLQMGLLSRVRTALSGFPSRQTFSGYFRSQEGEWDSNGQVLWVVDRSRRLNGQALPESWLAPVLSGARWIQRKRTSDKLKAAHAGLMPAGFSAEHLGPNDFYYWDDFWSVAGLRAAAAIAREHGQEGQATQFQGTADALMAAVARSLERSSSPECRGIPASPYRRMDAGCIGSLAASYPLQLCQPRDPLMLQTVDFLLEYCMFDGGFFQDVVHSGVNAYLTLHMAQVMLRAGDQQFFDLVQTVARLASPTGQWPEAIHPATGGGCMGDGQHVWAAAEWVVMIRNLFVREECGTLVLGSGLPRQWTSQPEASLSLGPTPTAFGPVSVRLERDVSGLMLHWQATWHGSEPPLRAEAPGYEAVTLSGTAGSVRLTPR